MTSRNHRSQNGMASSARENESLTTAEGPCPTVSDSEENKTLLEQKAKDLNDKAFARFLRAFRSVDQAFNAILRYLKWRKEFGVDSITVEDSDIKNELRSGKALLLEEKDNAGRQAHLIGDSKAPSFKGPEPANSYEIHCISSGWMKTLPRK
ncbi:uncharacterized protein LOC144685312 isoform X2 [Cetorhinus maximus]